MTAVDHPVQVFARFLRGDFPASEERRCWYTRRRFAESGFMNPPLPPTTSIARWVLPLVLVGLLANVVAWLTLGILPVEAYYWVWSERLQAGYFDHAPLIAWLIRPFTALF